MRTEPVDVMDVVTQVAARRRRVPVTVTVTGEPVVEADEAALRRAVDHVVANAARHATSAVRLSVRVVGGQLLVSVEDDGAGIPESAHERVLERFVRLDEGRARDAGGSGLGLAVANDVAIAHGGAVDIGRSPTLGGASVTLRLPVHAGSLALAGPPR
jgi:signal transduction histidine kinase